MAKQFRELFRKYREQILYLLFGGVTTAVDFGVSFLLYKLWIDSANAPDIAVHLVDVIAWALAVTFAFFTNRIWVFESQKKGVIPVTKEWLEFAGGRAITLLLQEIIIAISVTWLGGNKYLFRILAAVLVIILNYIISKLFVFRKTNGQ